MEVARTFRACIFDAATIRRALDLFGEKLGDPEILSSAIRRVDVGDDELVFDASEEFFNAYSHAFNGVDAFPRTV